MTKKLEELLDLPESKDIIQEDETKEKELRAIAEKEEKARQKKTMDHIRHFDKISAALPEVKGLDGLADIELDDIGKRALQSYEDLMDLGMNVEGRYSGRIFEVAGQMLKTSLDARVAKIDKKLRMVELQLKKEKIDNTKRVGDKDILTGDGYVVTDRNSLLEQLKKQVNDK